jgi:hypothetical protein
VSDRHRNLRAAVDVSWRLLGEEDRRALARLAVFRGGFPRRAAGRVADVDGAQLERFVDASRVRVLPNGRFERPPSSARSSTIATSRPISSAFVSIIAPTYSSR